MKNLNQKKPDFSRRNKRTPQATEPFHSADLSLPAMRINSKKINANKDNNQEIQTASKASKRSTSRNGYMFFAIYI
ncbi:hypothetical protein [Nonlabens ulvanivorans]|uniref:Uncharacterized protein n=1 Tax=Nonlabens ulvanivorans TaxID=906888 RepID=A0ABX5EBW4_NONUL|nr:hypothetical protein [Nonlabens ulvanivorans]PRX15750.1 hypothetical protein LY02_00973 [Nonlabens ulvanivorans]